MAQKDDYNLRDKIQDLRKQAILEQNSLRNLMSKQQNKTHELWDVKQARLTEAFQEWSKHIPNQNVAASCKKFAPHIAMCCMYAMAGLYYAYLFFKEMQNQLHHVPENIVYAVIGFVVCFCGSYFPATIAAAEAWYLCGGTEAINCMKMLYAEWQKVHEALLKDGGEELKNVSPQDFLVSKTRIVLATVEPETLSKGAVSLYTGWIGVLAICRLQFAKIVTLGERIGSAVYKPASRYEPYLENLVPNEYKKWVPVLLRWSCKLIAMTMAWTLARAVSAFHSALRGGLLFGRCLVDFLHERNIVSWSSDKAYMDEAIGWVVAGIGLLFQCWYRNGLPFPFNLLLLPVQLIESFIFYSIMA